MMMYGHTYSKSTDQPGKVANPARGQLNSRENEYFPSAFVPENLVSRDGVFSSPVPRQPAHLHITQAESGAYLRDSSRVPLRRSFIYFKPPYAIGSVRSLSGHNGIAGTGPVSLKVVPNEECCPGRSPWTN